MLYPSMNELTQKISNRYLLVNVVAKRAREIAHDSEENGEFLTEKPVKTAITDIAEGRVVGFMKEAWLETLSNPDNRSV